MDVNTCLNEQTTTATQESETNESPSNNSDLSTAQPGIPRGSSPGNPFWDATDDAAQAASSGEPVANSGSQLKNESGDEPVVNSGEPVVNSGEPVVNITNVELGVSGSGGSVARQSANEMQAARPLPESLPSAWLKAMQPVAPMTK